MELEGTYKAFKGYFIWIIYLKGICYIVLCRIKQQAKMIHTNSFFFNHNPFDVSFVILQTNTEHKVLTCSGMTLLFH